MSPCFYCGIGYDTDTDADSDSDSDADGYCYDGDADFDVDIDVDIDEDCFEQEQQTSLRNFKEYEVWIDSMALAKKIQCKSDGESKS